MIEVAYAGTGSMLRAARVVAFVLAWGTVREDLGREPTVIEYCAFWKEPHRTAYDQLHLFRQVFNVDFPGPVLDQVGAGASSKYDLRGVVAAS